MNNTWKNVLFGGVAFVAGVIFGTKNERAQKGVAYAEIAGKNAIDRFKSGLNKPKNESVQEEVKTEVTADDGGDFPPVG